MSNIKVSIIIPCYGVERYLNRCMESIVNQTLKDIEIILVDDHSPDRVPEMCDEWAKKDWRIKVVHKENNEGLGFARNTGLDIATGNFVAFVDADDYVDLKMYETLYDEATATEADIVYCGVKQELRKGQFFDVRDFNSIEIFERDSLMDLSIRYIDPPFGQRHYMSVWHSIYRQKTIGDLRFHSERVVCSEDLPFQISMILKAQRVVYVPDTFYYYCLNEGSLSKTSNFNKCFRYFTLTKIIKNFYPPSLQYHVWVYYFEFCIYFIRALIRSDIGLKRKISSLKRLCEREDIVDYFKKNKVQIMQRTRIHLSSLYMFSITSRFVRLLYLVALIDVHVICDKLGLKK